MDTTSSAIVIYVEAGIDDSQLLFNSEFTPELLTKRFTKLFSGDHIYYSVDPDYNGKLLQEKNIIVRNEHDDVASWQSFFSFSDCQNAIRILADAPLIDLAVISEMLEIHSKYLAEFSYSENLPEGLGCEIYSRELINSVPDMKGERETLSKAVRKNINQFDVELFYKAPDIRDLRCNWRTSDSRAGKIMSGVCKIKGDFPEYEELRTIIDNNPALLYTSPSYLEIEICGKPHINNIASVNISKNGHNDISLDLFKKIISDMKVFGDNYAVCFGGNGEPLQNREFYRLLETAINEPLINNIIIETDGFFCDDNYRQFLDRDKSGKVCTIIDMNGFNKETYLKIHQQDAFDTVLKNILALNECKKNDNSLYLEIMKINETENFLDDYYTFWEGYKIPIILQKQNTYLGAVTDRRYSDLTPLERRFCWHLLRDLYILGNGKVSYCKQDYDARLERGDLNKDSIQQIWQRGEKLFVDNYNKNYPEKPGCLLCDEWYTFNL